MPWIPELFSAPVLARWEARRQSGRIDVPYFDGMLAGELDALVESFADVPEVHDPVRGRVRGRRAFEAFVAGTAAWFQSRNVSVEERTHFITEPHGFEEVILHLDGPTGRVGLPVAIVVEHRAERIGELRVYFSSWPLLGRHANRPPLLQPDEEVRESDVVGEYQRALAAGDVEAIVATFEPDGYAREPAGGEFVHRGHEGLRSFYAHLFSNGGGIPLEHCTAIDDGHSCVVEYNVVRWGAAELLPEAGVGVYVRGSNGRLAAARIYDDTDPPLGSAS
jgi:hypothetical protein